MVVCHGTAHSIEDLTLIEGIVFFKVRQSMQKTLSKILLIAFLAPPVITWDLKAAVFPIEDDAVYNYKAESYGHFLARADEFYDQRHFQHALHNYLFALEIEPDLKQSFPFNYKVGFCFRSLGRGRDAIPYFRRAASDKWMGDYARFQLGQLLEAMPDSLPLALQTYRGLLAAYPKSVYLGETSMALGQLLLKNGEFNEGIRYLDWALALTNTDPNMQNLYQSRILLLKARAYLGLGKRTIALNTLMNIQQQFTFAPEAYEAKRLFSETKNKEGENLTIDEFIEGNDILIFHGHHQEALNELAEYRTLFTEIPDQTRIELNIARVYLAKGLYQAAIPRLKDLWERNHQTKALFELAKAARYAGDLDLSIWAYQTYLAVGPSSVGWKQYLLFEVANSFSAKGDSAALVASNRFYSELRRSGNPKSVYYYPATFHMAFNFYRMAQYDSAIAGFKEAAALSRWTRTKSEFWLAKAYEKDGQLEAASALFRKLALNSFDDYYGMLSEARHVSPGPAGDALFRTDIPLPVQPSGGYLSEIFTSHRLTDLVLGSVMPTATINDVWSKAWMSRSLAGPRVAARELRSVYDYALASYEKSTQLRNFLEAIHAYDEAVDFAVTMKKKYRTRMRRDPGTEWLFYPKYYEEMVKQYGHWYSLDEAFVFALIKNESAFRTYSVSRAQAIGLMQIMPFTGRALAAELGLESFQMTDLQNPAVSVQMGTYYLHQHAANYRNYAPAVLGAYNAGPHRADYWTRNFKLDDPEEFPEIVEIFETNKYIKRILLDRWIYAHR